jgi:conjugative transposon TraK protein
MFTKTKNIDTAFRHIKLFSIALVVGTILLCGFCIYRSYDTVTKLQSKVYVLANGKALEAYASERKDNIPIEAKDHIRTFHQYFFNLSPDDKAIIAGISRSLYLADESAKKQYDDLRESNYYSNVVSGNISQAVLTDSITVNTDAQPFSFRFYGKVQITRPTTIVTRSLVTEGLLRNVARSENNAHGFLIERWHIIENKDLNVKSR